MFIDDLGRLDVSRVEAANSELFLCVGVDAVGNTASTRIRVSSVDPEEGEVGREGGEVGGREVKERGR